MRLLPGALVRRWLVLTWGVAACASPAPPPALSQLAAVRESPATEVSQRLAPQAHAHATELERRARQALERGDATAAQAFAEHALAAHEHARALSRLARAEQRRLEADAGLSDQRRALAELRAQQQRLTAEATGLELRATVLKGALPLPPHDSAEPERRLARRRAAAALATQARLLCMAARLLVTDERIPSTLSRLDELDRKLEAPGASGLEAATELRSECLRMISAARRNRATLQRAPQGASSGASGAPNLAASTAPSSVSSPATRAAGAHRTPLPAGSIPADLLLAELSAAGAEPSRDDRGVAIVLRGLFAPDGRVSQSGRSELQRFAEVAKAHPDFPLLVVSHAGEPWARGESERRLDSVRTELQELGVSDVAVHAAGQRQPLLPRSSPSAKERNERLELIFVAPTL